MQDHTKAYLELHLAVLLYGLTAIFGDLISLAAISLVWWRVLLTWGSMSIHLSIFKSIKSLSRKELQILIIIGVLIAIHWIAFYGSIKLANASIALIGMSTLSLFTALLEPVFLKSKLEAIDIFFGVCMIPALLLIANNLDISMYTGLFLGILASLLLALFGILNKKHVHSTDPMTITFVEMCSAWLFITLIMPFVSGYVDLSFWPKGMDWVYLILLALLCTRYAFYLNIRALRSLSAFTSNLIFNLEPIYGIILAAIILHEHKELNLQFYLGAGLIMVLIFVYPIVKKRYRSRLNQT